MAPVSLPSDERRTPGWFFAACSAVWGPFDLDCFAADWNHQAERYYTIERDFYSAKGVRAQRAWVQPPYSRGQLYKSLGYVRKLVLEQRLGAATCLVPVDPSTSWWQEHIARPEGQPVGARWLTSMPPPFNTGAYALVSERLVVTIAPPSVRVAFEPPPWVSDEERAKFKGAKQPSVVVTFERNAA